jgi:bacillithiol system protein YtxJ
MQQKPSSAELLSSDKEKPQELQVEAEEEAHLYADKERFLTSAYRAKLAAREEYESFRRHNPDVPTMFVDVIDDRAVARGLADLCGVRHESPQAIVFEQGKPVWNASHRAITRGSLEAAWGCKC